MELSEQISTHLKTYDKSLVKKISMREPDHRLNY